MSKSKNNLRPDNYFLECFIAVSLKGGGSLNQIGRQVAIACGVSDTKVLESAKNEEGYKLEENFKKSIERSLTNLVTDNKIFKRFIDIEGFEIEEEKALVLKSSQYRVYYHLNCWNDQIIGSDYLIRQGVILHPLNNIITYKVDDMLRDNPRPKDKSRLLLINDYHWAVSLTLKHEDLPAKFILAHKIGNVVDVVNKFKNFAETKGISTRRAALVMLENTSYDFQGIDSGFIEIDITGEKEIIVTNHANDPLLMSFDGFFYDVDEVRRLQVKLLGEGLNSAAIIKHLHDQGYYKEDYSCKLDTNEKSKDISPFSPVDLQFLRYSIVIDQGV